MTTASILIHVLTVGWGVLCGGVIYEHLAVVPVWSAQPPASLTMWRGAHRVRAERFWMSIHPVLLLLLGASIALTWSDPARDHLLITAGGYVVILATTAVWFVPELLKLTQAKDDAAIPAPEWRRRAKRWEALSLIRGVIIVGLSWPVLRALSGG